jgi:ATP-binding cassette subfamily A (ABC1) protein 3
MEEASVLGKRIGIINLGKMKCIGTPLFLIEKFGKYMNITLNKEEGAINDKICDYITQKTGEAKFESLSEEILARIPKDCFSQEKGMTLHDFFEDLDENLEELKVKSYSVSMPTLEDVFLNVAQDEGNERFSVRVDMQKINENNLFELDYLNRYSCCGKFCADFSSNFIRRFYLIIRDKKGFIMEVFCPIALILIGCFISQVNFFYSTPPFGSKDINKLGKQKIYYASLNDTINKEDYFIHNLNNVTCENLTEFDKYMNESETFAINQFINVLYDKTKDSESTSDNDIDMNDEDYVGCYGNMLLLKEGNGQNENYEAVFLVNSRVIQGVPLYTSAFLEQIIKKGSKNNVNINYQHKVMGITYEEEISSSGSSNIIVFFVAIAYALIPANFISTIVRERTNNSKHLMKLSGMNMLSYWLANFIYELIKFYFTGGLCLLILYLFEYNTPYIIEFYILYGPSLVFMTYAISFLFNDESNAQNKTILLHALIGALGSNVILILIQIDNTKSIGQFLEFIFCFLPSFCFSFAYNLGKNKASIIMSEYGKEYVNDDSKLMEEFLLLKGPYSYLIAEIFIYMLILIIEEASSNKAICPQRRLNINNNEIGRDSGVIREEQRAQTDKDNNNGNLINLNNENNYMIRVKNLQKDYGSCCCRKKKNSIAIKNLNFCLEKGECFGLLGLNGAGKTTTFKCITQEISPTYGEIFLNGNKTNNDFDSIKNKFGYCPQYDAIFEYMTVYENLEFYAKLKGVKKEFLTQIVNKVIYEMRLEEFIKKMAGRLSGGNKRKLSVAIAMLCSPPIILLDEPSTGMDPEARRFMWSSIHKLSIMGKKSSIIMTTHSMDEAETLCKRMGIMVNGEFVCLGRAHEIKDKYGYGYELNVRIKPMSEKLEDELFIKKYNLDNRIKVDMSNIANILEQIHKKNYLDEIRQGRLGEKLIRDIEKSNGISINALLNWVFFVQNAIKLVQYGIDNFSKIIVEENMDNNFLFKMKKKQDDNKSIGYLFGLFEIHKEECYVTEYSIQQTSLEQIFNKFAENQGSQLKERTSTIVEPGDVENIAMDSLERRKTIMYDKIVVTDNLIKKLLDDE